MTDKSPEFDWFREWVIHDRLPPQKTDPMREAGRRLAELHNQRVMDAVFGKDAKQ